VWVGTYGWPVAAVRSLSLKLSTTWSTEDAATREVVKSAVKSMAGSEKCMVDFGRTPGEYPADSSKVPIKKRPCVVQKVQNADTIECLINPC
jgi:hypothetical protein